MPTRFETGLAGWFQAFFTSHPVRWLALLCLCSPYLISAILKIHNFGSGIDEMTGYGLTHAAPYAAMVTVIQLGCSLMVLTGFLRWIGALALAAFTMAATCIADPFWNALPAEQPIKAELFLEHLALSGALILVAWYTLHRWRSRGKDDWT